VPLRLAPAGLTLVLSTPPFCTICWVILDPMPGQTSHR
jgi:hypothetical protein